MSGYRMRLAIIGNCQAEALRSIIYNEDRRFEIINLPEYHTMMQSDVDSVLSLLDSADLVMAQRVAPDYSIESIRPQNLRERLGEKCIIWPNIYFDGYFPGLRYIYGNDSQKLIGPLGDYHFNQVFTYWLNGHPPHFTSNQLMSTDSWDWYLKNPAQLSLSNLRQREFDCDVKISDHIERNFCSRKLMYTMNHPRNSVLLEMIDRLLAYAGIQSCYRIEAAHQTERLGGINIPALPRYFATQSSSATPSSFFEGFSKPYAESSPLAQRYNPLELVEAFYSLYQTNRSLLVPSDWPKFV